MSDRDMIAGMTEHGIHTSQADYWIHLFPLQQAVYWYAVPLMLEFIAMECTAITIGKSKDRTETGAGYLVSKTCPVVQSDQNVPDRYFAQYDWRGATDREKSRRGELIVAALIEHNVVKLPQRKVTRAQTIEEQFAGYDGTVGWVSPIKWEAKTECIESRNLFVQTHERGHRPNLTSDGHNRPSDLPPLRGGTG